MKSYLSHYFLSGRLYSPAGWGGYPAKIIGLLLLVGLLAACQSAAATSAGAGAAKSQPGYSGKKILFVNSYHKGYEWSDGIESGIQTGLKGTGVEYKTVYLDTKQKPGDEFGRQAGQQARAEIEAFKPDV